MTIFLKFVHLAAIAIWAGGLFVLPFLFQQRQGLGAGLWIAWSSLQPGEPAV